MSAGFAIRRAETCQASEVDCGETDKPYRACCPESSSCPTQYNVDCCPSSRNCTAEIVSKPRCANDTWDLFDNRGYFCCEKGLVGYATTRDSDGCASPGYTFEAGEEVLPLIRAGKDPDDEPAESSPTPSAESSPTPPADDSSPGAPVGAIAGGVVGGVAGLALIALLIWYFFLRKPKASEPLDDGSQFPPKSPLTTPPAYASPVGFASPAELDNISKPSELQGDGSGPSELYGGGAGPGPGLGRHHVSELPG